ncbi:helix-turn-helix domain-containing protein [Actinacidiphila yeochonensis]|uniref:helix-turn-helix domain-containing protein n=1 Tax=Actinacidiphila yeochonensis TaxID=89050 RepID=UPI00068EA6D1|nr:helix-turn-helix transcriptional regulator [Actinacidiphila yeochonensis]
MRTFGAAARALRTHAGYSRKQFGNLVRFSEHTVASVENGRRLADQVYITRAEELTGNTGALREAVKHIGRRPGLASWFRRWARMEATAVTLYTYENRMVPGLLQTEAYAKAMYDDHLPPMDDDEIDAQWLARAERQLLLDERPHTEFGFILEEQVFVRRTGGAAVTRELIDHVLALAARRNVELLIMPLVSERHAGLAGPMQLLETPENRWFAYCEAQRGGHYTHDPKEISLLHQRYARLRSQALSARDSVGLLQRARGDL